MFIRKEIKYYIIKIKNGIRLQYKKQLKIMKIFILLIFNKFRNDEDINVYINSNKNMETIKNQLKF